jgi:hypothetical protein
MRRLLFLLLLLPVGALAWGRRSVLLSAFMRLVAAAQPNPAKRHGVDIRIPIERGGWIRRTLKVDLSPSLSEVVGYPVEAAAYSHYGGFNLGPLYADFVNPDSEYYQGWIGAYAIFDSERRKHFGFDDQGKPIDGERMDILEADQRLVFWAAGCPKKFPDGRLVRPIGDTTTSEVDIGGERWWRVEGQAETWSCYHRGRREGNWRHYWASGVVPEGASHPVDDFHPLTYSGSVWMRYVPEWGATCAKFYIFPEYVDRNGQKVTKGREVETETRAIVDRIAFSKR